MQLLEDLKKLSKALVRDGNETGLGWGDPTQSRPIYLIPILVPNPKGAGLRIPNPRRGGAKQYHPHPDNSPELRIFGCRDTYEN